MYAIIEAAGRQLKVSEGDVIQLPALVAEPGAEHEISRVLLVADDSGRTVGKPLVEGAKVLATVVSHGKGEKTLIFKKKKRTKYRRMRGHRQDVTELKIGKIVVA